MRLLVSMKQKILLAAKGGTHDHCERLIQHAEIIREKGTDRSQFLRGQVDKYSWVDIGSSLLAWWMSRSILIWPSCSKKAKFAVAVLSFSNLCSGINWASRDCRCASSIYSKLCTTYGHMFYLLMPSLHAREALSAKIKDAENNCALPLCSLTFVCWR